MAMTTLKTTEYGLVYSGPRPETVYGVNSITGAVTEHATRDNGVANRETQTRWLAIDGPWSKCFLTLAAANEYAGPIAAEFARQRAISRDDFMDGFRAAAANFSDALEDGGSSVELEAQRAWEHAYETYPTAGSGRRAAQSLIDASDLSPNETPCSGGSRHDWRVVSHEEFRCARCGEYKFVPDL